MADHSFFTIKARLLALKQRNGHEICHASESVRLYCRHHDGNQIHRWLEQRDVLSSMILRHAPALQTRAFAHGGPNARIHFDFHNKTKQTLSCVCWRLRCDGSAAFQGGTEPAGVYKRQLPPTLAIKPHDSNWPVCSRL